MKKRGIALLLCACLGLTGTMGTVRAQAAGSEESSSSKEKTVMRWTM